MNWRSLDPNTTIYYTIHTNSEHDFLPCSYPNWKKQNNLIQPLQSLILLASQNNLIQPLQCMPLCASTHLGCPKRWHPGSQNLVLERRNRGRGRAVVVFFQNNVKKNLSSIFLWVSQLLMRCWGLRSFGLGCWCFHCCCPWSSWSSASCWLKQGLWRREVEKGPDRNCCWENWKSMDGKFWKLKVIISEPRWYTWPLSHARLCRVWNRENDESLNWTTFGWIFLYILYVLKIMLKKVLLSSDGLIEV